MSGNAAMAVARAGAEPGLWVPGAAPLREGKRAAERSAAGCPRSSKAAAHITGHILNVDGGLRA